MTNNDRKEFSYVSELNNFIIDEYGRNLTPSELLTLLQDSNIYMLDIKCEIRELSEEEKSVFKLVLTHRGKYCLFVNGEKRRCSVIGHIVDVTNEYNELIKIKDGKKILSTKVALERDTSVNSYYPLYKRRIYTNTKVKRHITKDKNTIHNLIFYYFETKNYPTCELLKNLIDGTINDEQFLKLCNTNCSI